MGKKLANFVCSLCQNGSKAWDFSQNQSLWLSNQVKNCPTSASKLGTGCWLFSLPDFLAHSPSKCIFENKTFCLFRDANTIISHWASNFLPSSLSDFFTWDLREMTSRLTKNKLQQQQQSRRFSPIICRAWKVNINPSVSGTGRENYDFQGFVFLTERWDFFSSVSDFLLRWTDPSPFPRLCWMWRMHLARKQIIGCQFATLTLGA